MAVIATLAFGAVVDIPVCVVFVIVAVIRLNFLNGVFHSIYYPFD